MQEKLKKRLAGALALIWLLAIASAYTSDLGLGISNAWYEAAMVAAAGAGIQIWYWGYCLKRYPNANPSERKKFMALSAVICVVVFFASTQWSAVMLGGKIATMAYMQDAIGRADKKGAELYTRSLREYNLGGQIGGLADRFDEQAQNEAGGDRSGSGMKGEGDVFFALRLTGANFRMVSKNIETNHTKQEELWKQLQEAIDAARQISMNVIQQESRSAAFRENILAFSKQIAVMNKTIAGMDNTSSEKFVEAVNENLKMLEAKSGDSAAQKDAVTRAGRLVDQAKTIVGQITKKKVEMPGANASDDLVPIVSMDEAVFRYWQKCLPEWAMAIILDFAYIPIILALAIGKRQDNEEETRERAEAAAAAERERLAAEEARKAESRRKFSSV